MDIGAGPLTRFRSCERDARDRRMVHWPPSTVTAQPAMSLSSYHSRYMTAHNVCPSFPRGRYTVNDSESMVKLLSSSTFVSSVNWAPPGRNPPVERRDPFHRDGIKWQEVTHTPVLIFLSPVGDPKHGVIGGPDLARMHAIFEGSDSEKERRMVLVSRRRDPCACPREVW